MVPTMSKIKFFSVQTASKVGFAQGQISPPQPGDWAPVQLKCNQWAVVVAMTGCPPLMKGL